MTRLHTTRAEEIVHKNGEIAAAVEGDSSKIAVRGFLVTSRLKPNDQVQQAFRLPNSISVGRRERNQDSCVL